VGRDAEAKGDWSYNDKSGKKRLRTRVPGSLQIPAFPLFAIGIRKAFWLISIAYPCTRQLNLRGSNDPKLQATIAKAQGILRLNSPWLRLPFLVRLLSFMDSSLRSPARMVAL
jgi:hypothetical protein